MSEKEDSSQEQEIESMNDNIVDPANLNTEDLEGVAGGDSSQLTDCPNLEFCFIYG